MRPRALAALFLLVAGLLAFIWFYERELPSTDQRAELAAKVLRVKPDEVVAVTLARGDGRVRLERESTPPGEGDEPAEEPVWRLREPLAALADRVAVAGLVDELAGLEKKRTLEAVEPAELGLAEPRGRITLETGEETIELVVGSAVPASSTMIVGVTGSESAYVVGDRLWSELEKPAGDWRSRDLGPRSRDAITLLSLTAGERRVTLGRRGESFWVESPYVDRADRELVSSLLGELTGLRAESFIDRPGAEPELAAGVVEAILDGREQPWRLELGGEAGAAGELRLARIEGQLIEVRSGLAEALDRPAEQWRSPAWSGLEVYQVDRLEVRDGEGETVFERQGGDWLRDGSRVDYDPVSDLLYAVTGVEADSLSPGAPAGEPRLTLVLSGDADERRETLTLFPRTGEASPAGIEGREVTLLLDEGTVSDLEFKLDEARRAEPPAPADEDGPQELGED